MKKKIKKENVEGKGHRLNTHMQSGLERNSKKSVNFDSDENIFQLYLREIERIPLLNKEEEEKTARLAVAGDNAARERLVNANLRFAIMVAKKYQGKGLPLEDLISEGNIGLLNAVKHFDVEKGYRFITYAVWWIRQAIIKAIHEKGRLIRLPCNKGVDIMRIEKTRQIMQTEPKQKTSEEIRDVAAFLDMPPEDVKDLVQLSKDTVSMEEPASKSGKPGNPLTVKDFIEDKITLPPADQAIHKILREDLEKALCCIDEREADVIRCRYGLGGFIPMTLKEVGNRYNLSRERVRQLEKRALKGLQLSSFSDRLEGYTA